MNAYLNDANHVGHRQHPPTATLNDSPGLLPQEQEDEERLLPRGGIVSRTPSSATAAVAVAVAAMTAKSTDCHDDFGYGIDDDDNDAPFFTFHPVDEPDVEVVVSNIFSDSSALARVGSNSDDNGSATAAPHNDNDNNSNVDLSRSQPSRSSRRKRSHSELALRSAASGVPTYISDEEDGDGDGDEYNNLPGSSCDASTLATTGGCATGMAAPSSLLAEVTVGPLTNAFPSAPETTVDDCEYDDNDDDNDDENEDDNDDDFEARQRKEEEEMDEEQLRKKRRVEEEERIARNNLWRQSIKRSMFLEPPGAVMNKRATM